MNIQESSTIQGLRQIVPKVFKDLRGEFFETFNVNEYVFRDDTGNPICFIEDDVSVSKKNVLRGLHGDSNTWKLVQCLSGSLYYVVVDFRPTSPTYLKWQSFILNDEFREQLLIPAGCANGHLVLSEKAILSYKQSQLYTGKTNQFSLRWNDPKLDIEWPIDDPVLSARDAEARRL